MSDNKQIHNLPQQGGDINTLKAQIEYRLKSTPDDLEALGMLAAVNGTLGLYDETVDICKKIVSMHPQNVTALQNMAHALTCKGLIEEAIPVRENLAKIKPDDAKVLYELGYAYMLSNKHAQAAVLFDRVSELKPDFLEPRLLKARMFTQFGHPGKAIEIYQEVLEIDSNHCQARFELANALMTSGNMSVAEEQYKKVISTGYDNVDAIAGLAILLKKQGRYDDSMKLLKPLIEAENLSPSIAVAYAHLARHFDIAADAISLLEGSLKNHPDSTNNYSQAYFQLGKLYESVKNYSESFKNYQHANNIQAVISDPLSAIKLIEKNINLWTPKFIADSPSASNLSNVPIFIVGLPRTGTSLIEQILASHPEVYGAGELHVVPDLVADMPQMLGLADNYPQCLKKLTQEVIDELSNMYLSRVKSLASGDPARITDKMPSNYLHIGLIRLMFPDSHIIHCKRNPIDTCLSIYFNEFPLAAFTTSLDTLGAHYLKYELMMEHWDNLPGQVVHTVVYEKLVENPEENIRALLKYCDLAWDDACLNYHSSKRFVNTLSHEQVRKPIYKDSVKRWENYQANLGPLLTSLKLDM